MSEENKLSYQEEFDLLKSRANKLGIKFSPNIGLDTLREKVNEKLSANKKEEQENLKDNSPAAIRKRLYKEQMRLIRCRITNLNPAKKDLKGEIFTVANEYLGTIKKFVPYDEAGNAYHLPFILFNELKNKKFVQRQLITDPKTKEQRIISKWVPEFNLEVLEPLTKEQLAKLASSQRAHNAIDTDTTAIN